MHEMNYLESFTIQCLDSIKESLQFTQDNINRLEYNLGELYNSSWGWLGQSLEEDKHE
jgi:hypothetical protein